MPALDALIQTHGQVVAQVIEAILAVGPIGNICPVCLNPRHHLQLMLVFDGRGLLKVNHESGLTVIGAGCHLQDAY